MTLENVYTAVRELAGNFKRNQMYISVSKYTRAGCIFCILFQKNLCFLFTYEKKKRGYFKAAIFGG